jgi:hypothetical protein
MILQYRLRQGEKLVVVSADAETILPCLCENDLDSWNVDSFESPQWSVQVYIT